MKIQSCEDTAEGRIDLLQRRSSGRSSEANLSEEVGAGLEGLQVGTGGEILRQLLCQVLQHVQGSQGRLCNARWLRRCIPEHAQHEACLGIGRQLLKLVGIDIMEVLDQGVIQPISFQQEVQDLQTEWSVEPLQTCDFALADESQTFVPWLTSLPIDKAIARFCNAKALLCIASLSLLQQISFASRPLSEAASRRCGEGERVPRSATSTFQEMQRQVGAFLSLQHPLYGIVAKWSRHHRPRRLYLIKMAMLV